MKPSETLIKKGSKKKKKERETSQFSGISWPHLKGTSIFSSLKMYSKGQ